MNVLVIGGTLFVGRMLVAELPKQGHQVTVLHRKAGHDLGNEVASIQADRNQPESVRRALSGRTFDVVFDNVYDWERGTTASQVEATALACGDSLQRYIFLSSVAAYPEGLNRREEDGPLKDDFPSPYARNKAESEHALFRLHQKSGFPAVTIRPPYIYGPGNPFYREAFFWDRLRDGRPIIIPEDGSRLMHFVYVKDLVRALLRAMEEPAAVGQAFNVANTEPVTQVETVRAFAEAAGEDAQLVYIPRERIITAGGDPMVPPLYFAVYFDMPPITEVIGKARRVLGFEPTDFRTGLRETFEWYSRQPAHRPDYGFEDRLLALHETARAPGGL
ncbi:MAG: SDR family oxidoreductase [Bryobacteraceae bacterium]